MSVEDVCELGSLLQSGDKEKKILERKLIELDGAIQTQDRRLNHEMEAEQWARNEQNNLLEYAVNASNDFEIASSVVSQVHEDTVSTQLLSNILERVNAYIALRNDLAEDIGSVQSEIGRLIAASKRVGDYKSRGIHAEITDANNLIASSEISEEKMIQSLVDIESELEQKTSKIEEKLIAGASNISNLFPHLEQSKGLVNNKIKDLERKLIAERVEADTTLSSLQAAKNTSSQHVDVITSYRDSIIAQGDIVKSSTSNDEALLLSSQEENISLQKNLEASTEAEHDTANELEKAKKLLAELDKFASDNFDELDRIRRAQAFEVMREEAFLKSQSGNTGSAQQICGEAEKLRLSLELVRSEIEQVKQQIVSDSTGSDGTHDGLRLLDDTKKAYQTRSETAHSRILECEQQGIDLEDRIAIARSRREAADGERSTQENVRETLLVQHEKSEGILRDLSEQIRSYAPPSDREKASESLTAQSADLHSSHEALEEEERGVIEEGERVQRAGVAHMRDVEAYNAERERGYELSDKDKRLRLSRQNKLLETERALKGYQQDLQREDDRFKEAIRAAEDGARATEEKLVATMNQVIEVGLQLIADRNRHRDKVKEIESSTQLLDKENEEQLAALADVINRGSGPSSQAPTQAPKQALKQAASRDPGSRNQTQNHTQNQVQSPRKSQKVLGGRNSHGGRSPTYTWTSSSPATNLPPQPPLKDHDNDDNDDDNDGGDEKPVEGTKRRQSHQDDPPQKQKQLKDALVKRKPLSAAATTTNESYDHNEADNANNKRKGRLPSTSEGDKNNSNRLSSEGNKNRLEAPAVSGARMRGAGGAAAPAMRTGRNKENDPDEANVPRAATTKQYKRKS